MQHTISHIYNNYAETDSSISKQLFVDMAVGSSDNRLHSRR